MFADRQVKQALDLDYILEKISPCTSYGRAYKAAIKAYPPGTEDYLRQDLDLLEAFIDWSQDKEKLRDVMGVLHGVKDVRYSIKRAREEAVLSEVELFEVKTLVFAIKDLVRLLKDTGLLESSKTRLEPIGDLEEALNPQGQSTKSFYIYDDYSDDLSEMRRVRSDLENKIRMEVRRRRTQLKKDHNLSLSADQTVVLSKQDKDSIKRAQEAEDLSFSSETFSTLVYSLKLGDAMLESQDRVEALKGQEEEEELRIRSLLSERVAESAKSLLDNIHGLGNIDLYIAKAAFAKEISGVKPEIVDDHRILIEEGRYPKVQAQLKKQGMDFTPISIELDEGVTCITGANMGGKTISIKIVGLLAIMAQVGLFVPAQRMVYGLNEFVRTSIGDFQSTESGLSTFGGEIKNVSQALEEVDKRGLVLIDELARGTNPQEGYAISFAIARYLVEKESITIITTHFDEITKLDGVKHLQVVGLQNVDLDDLGKTGEDPLKQINSLMDYRLEEVSQFTQVPKDAIRIAQLMGLPRDIVAYAEDALGEKEKGE